MASLPEINVGTDGAIDLGDLKAADEAVDFAALPEPPSGQSLTSWTAVIRRQQAAADAAGAGGPVKVDAPSDKDLLRAAGCPGRQPATRTRSRRPTCRCSSPRPGGASRTSTWAGWPWAPGRASRRSSSTSCFPPSDAGGAMPAPEPPLSAGGLPAGHRGPAGCARAVRRSRLGRGPRLGHRRTRRGRPFVDPRRPAEAGGRASARAANGSVEVLEFGADAAPPPPGREVSRRWAAASWSIPTPVPARRRPSTCTPSRCRPRTSPTRAPWKSRRRPSPSRTGGPRPRSRLRST